MEKISPLFCAGDAPAVEGAELDAGWWHDLGNAVIGARAALKVAEAELDEGRVATAQQFLGEALAASASAIALLREVVALDDRDSDS